MGIQQDSLYVITQLEGSQIPRTAGLPTCEQDSLIVNNHAQSATKCSEILRKQLNAL